MTRLNVEALIEPMIQTYRTGKNQTFQWRRDQLKSVLRMLNENEERWIEAIYTDLRKERTEAMYSEILVVENEIKMMLKYLPTWMKDEHVSSLVATFPSFCKVQSVPLLEPGCLIISPFNYPINLSLLPVVGSLAGGNPCVLKPSELCPTVAALFTELVPKYFDKGVFQVVEGSVDEVTQLIHQRWGKIVFTGSPRVGKIVQTAAASTLTPTLLELGGKSPVIIPEDCPDDMRVVCQRLISTKMINMGQTCVAPDYVMIHRSKVVEFCKEAELALERLYGKDRQHSELSRIVNAVHTKRLIDMIQEVEQLGAKLLMGGPRFDVQDKFIDLTMVLDPPLESRIMKEEIFGPILPIVTFDNDEEVIQHINKSGETPLALYCFTKSNQRYEKFCSKCPAGMVMRNDCMLHQLVSDFPFTGLGTSGIGVYTGKYSFDAFTHKRPTMYHILHKAFEYANLRYHPHGKIKGSILCTVGRYVPNVPFLSLRTKLCLMSGMALAIHSHWSIRNAAIDLADSLEYLARTIRKYA
jgi:acyl-CoA reductase-like NAD-dependent aldehyde dehydrogenase